ncbi:MAG TPA: site-specific integrase [Hyphomicrobiaceae bacterium]|nr:site-specific integrase [Hyphomicrobiaceae bacterium]
MSVAKLTKRAMDVLEPDTRPYVVYDTDLTGFGVRVMPTGFKSWIVEYRPGDGGRRIAKKRMTLGATTMVTAEQARRRAREILAAARLGFDPSGDREKNRNTPTFKEFVERYLEEEAELKLKPRTVANYRIYFRKHAQPWLGALQLNAITKADIARLHRSVGKAKPATANRVVEAISSLFRYAETAGEVEEGFNPTRGISHFKERSRERFLSVDEFKRLGATLRLAETAGLPWDKDEIKARSKHLAKEENQRIVFSPYVTAAIRLLLFTGCRMREILHLRWDEIDFERGLLALPDSKTGKRFVVLNSPAIEVLHGLERLGEYVIVSESADRPRADLNRPWRRIRKHARLGELRIHDLRHSFASVGAAGGMGLPIVGKLLGHTQAQTTARYAHLDDDPLRRASEQIGNEIERVMMAGEMPSQKERIEKDPPLAAPSSKMDVSS